MDHHHFAFRGDRCFATRTMLSAASVWTEQALSLQSSSRASARSVHLSKAPCCHSAVRMAEEVLRLPDTLVLKDVFSFSALSATHEVVPNAPPSCCAMLQTRVGGIGRCKCNTFPVPSSTACLLLQSKATFSTAGVALRPPF